jgi:hypothetical protein
MKANTQTYSRRDSATKLLRKMGISADKYNDFIEKTDDGNFVCQVAKAERYLTQFSKLTIGAVCCELILAGKSNVEVFEQLQEKFGAERINDKKRGYPAWYRCKLRRDGKLPAKYDTQKKKGK